MKCSNCDQEGHNSKNRNCVTNIISNNLHNMTLFTQTPEYYGLSLQYLLSKYRDKFCYISSEQLVWEGNILRGTEDLISVQYCPVPLVYVKLNLRGEGFSHANYVLFNRLTMVATRYEPHGILENDQILDRILKTYSEFYGYVYIDPFLTCPYIGMQSVSMDTIGMCQTVALYSLVSILNPRITKWKPSSYITQKNTLLARQEIKKFASIFLTNIYYILPEDSRVTFLLFNDASVFGKASIRNDLSQALLL